MGYRKYMRRIGLLGGIAFAGSACASGAGSAQRVIVENLKGCPTYAEEVAFPTYIEDPGVQVAQVQPAAAEGTNNLDRVYDAIQTEFRDGGIKLRPIENGFRDLGLSIQKVPGPDGRVTREILITVDGDVSFSHGSSRLTARARGLVEKVGSAMSQYANTSARIGGHTDSTGGFALNQRLSLKRAQSVEQALKTKHNIAAERITDVKGFADTRKVVDTTKSEPRNRRVEIRVSIDE